MMGNLDAQIRCFDPLRADKPLQLLSEHWDNISVLATYDHSAEDSDKLPVFVSGSWDKTARLWVWDSANGGGRWQCRLVLRGHDEAVWGVQIVEPPSLALLQPESEQIVSVAGQGRYLTSSADLFIRLFHGDQLHAVYAGHTDVVRSLRLLPPLPSTEPLTATHEADPALYPDEALFASTSNDTTVRIWSLDPRRSPNPGNGGEALRILRGHESLVYDVAAFLDRHSQAPRLVSSGEDGSIRVWDWRSGALLQTVAVPVVSVWSIAVLPGSRDVVVGCSDSCVRVYSRHAPSARPSLDSHFGGAPLSDAEAALEDEKANDVQQARNRLAVEAKEPSGETADADTQAGEMWEGQRYDFVLRIDVADDAEPLPLPINRADDRQRVASDFVALHKLPESYVDKIVDFINLVLG